MTEHQIQSNLFTWAAYSVKTWPELALLFAVPNESYGGTKKDMIRGAKFKREGRKRGIPDIMLPVARKGFNGLFIEVKKKGGRLSADQKKWIQDLNDQGYHAKVIYSVEEGIKLINEYLNID